MKFSEYLKEHKLSNKPYEYVGNCVNSFDDDGDCVLSIFRDTSDFAVAEEESKEVSKEVSKDIVKTFKMSSELEKIAKRKTTKLLYNEDRDIYFLYDTKKDIHYFFVR